MEIFSYKMSCFAGRILYWVLLSDVTENISPNQLRTIREKYLITAESISATMRATSSVGLSMWNGEEEKVVIKAASRVTQWQVKRSHMVVVGAWSYVFMAEKRELASATPGSDQSERSSGWWFQECQVGMKYFYQRDSAVSETVPSYNC